MSKYQQRFKSNPRNSIQKLIKTEKLEQQQQVSKTKHKFDLWNQNEPIKIPLNKINKSPKFKLPLSPS